MNTTPKLPTRRLSLTPATLAAILPGFKKICLHLSGRGLESHLNPSPNDPILIRLSDRYANQRFDQHLARSFCELKDRLFAVNRKSGGDLQLSLPDVTMIAFAIRHGRDAQKGRKASIVKLEKRIENLRIRLYRATVSEGGPESYERFHERWSAFMRWIQHKIAYQREVAAKRRRKSKRTGNLIPAKLARRNVPRARDPEVERNPLDVATEALIRKLAGLNHTELSGMEVRRAVGLVKERARKGGFDFYLLPDLLDHEEIFAPLLTRFLIKKKVLIDLSTAQSARAAKFRSSLVVKEQPGTSTGTTVSAAPVMTDRGAGNGSRAQLGPGGAAESKPTVTQEKQPTRPEAVERSRSEAAHPEKISQPPPVQQLTASDREVLVKDLALFLAGFSPYAREQIATEALNRADKFVPPKHSHRPRSLCRAFTSLKAPERQRHPGLLVEDGPLYWEPDEILRILLGSTSASDAAKIIQEAYARTLVQDRGRETAAKSSPV